MLSPLLLIKPDDKEINMEAGTDVEEEMAEASREVAHGTFWNLAGTFFSKILSFIYTIYIAHAVSQGDIGIFYLALGIVGLIGVWKDLGLPSALIRYIPYFESRGEHGKANSLLKYSYAVTVALGVVLTAIVWLLADPIGGLYGNAALPEALRLMSLYVLLDNILKIGSAYIQGKAEMKLGQVISNVSMLAKLVLTVLLFQVYGATVATLTAAFLGSMVVGIVISLPIVAGRMVTRTEHAGPGLARSEVLGEIMPFGIMLTILQTFNVITSSTDKVLLGYLAPQSVAVDLVAIYSFALTLGNNIIVFPAAVGGIFLPIISRMVGKQDLGGVRRQIGTSQRWILMITLPMAAVMVAFAGEMLTIFFGGAYSCGHFAMAVSIIGMIFMAFAYTVSLALAGMRLVKLELYIAAASGLMNVMLNILLIPAFGMEGAAVATAISLGTWGLLMMHYGKKMTGFESPASAYRLVAAGVITCLLIFALKPIVAFAAMQMPPVGEAEMQPYTSKVAYLFLLGIVSLAAFAAFGVLAIALKCFELDDLMVSRKIFRRFEIPNWIESLGERIILVGIKK